MDIENQIVKIRVNNFNTEHFKMLGYEFVANQYIEIPAKDLPSGSGIKIDVQCQYCGNMFKKPYRRYLETKNDICCNRCRNQKITKISLNKYGNKCSLCNPEIQNKSKETNMRKLGVQYPFQNKEILKKCREKCIKKYGFRYREHIVSKQQKYLYNLYGGILNYSEYPFMLDIFFPNELIYFEYDGSGHDLSVKLQTCTKENFEIKEQNRRSFLYKKGYREFRIISKSDDLPNDEDLINIKNRAFKLLLNEGYSQYIYDLDNKIESFKI